MSRKATTTRVLSVTHFHPACLIRAQIQVPDELRSNGFIKPVTGRGTGHDTLSRCNYCDGRIETYEECKTIITTDQEYGCSHCGLVGGH